MRITLLACATAFSILGCSKDNGFSGKNAGKTGLEPRTSHQDQDPAPCTEGDLCQGTEIPDSETQVPNGYTPKPEDRDDYVPPQLATFACELTANKVYTNFTTEARFILKTGAGTVSASVNGADAPAGGGVVKIPLSSIADASQPFQSLTVKARIFGSNGASAECQATLETSKLEADFSFTVPQEASVVVNNGSCASDGRVGVVRFDTTLRNLFAEDTFTSFATNPITEDLRLVQCQPAEAKAAQSGGKLFSQKIRCLYVAKGTTAHIQYVNNQTILVVQGPNVPETNKSLNSKLTICSYPGSDSQAPCTPKTGRTVISALSAPLSAASKGMIMCPAVLPSGDNAKNAVAPFVQ
jgi:hypothetical protein